MRQQTIGIYLVILCIIFSIGNINEGIVHTQKNKETITHDQGEKYQINQDNHFRPYIVIKTNTKLPNNQTVFEKYSLQATTSTKTDSNITGFISTWDTTRGLHSPSTSPSSEIKLPLVSDGTYDFNVSWGDGSSNLITSYNQSAVTHTYKFLTCCIYTINITGTIVGWRFNGTGDAPKLLQISNWGPLRVGNDGYYFSGAKNLVISASDPLNLNGTTNLAGMFINCTSTGFENLNSWNVSRVTDMSSMFAFDFGFNQSLYSWNVSQVTDMSYMFYNASSFNQPLDTWKVSQVTDMNSMFFNACNFNQSLDSWDVSDVKDMNSMFAEASEFNQPLDKWNVSQVTDMSSMFNYAPSFNQPLDTWNVSQVTDMSSMFAHVSLSISNYDKLLIGWSSLPNLQHNVVFDAGYSHFGKSAKNAREKLIKNFNWSITDGGISESSSIISLGIIGLIIIAITSVIGISAYVSIIYFEYMKTKNKERRKDLKCWNHIKNTVIFKRHNNSAKDTLSSETFDKIEKIIDENKDN